MHTTLRVILIITGFLCIAVSFSAIAQSTSGKSQTPSAASKKPLVTFVELGSVRCIPCKQMQPVMKAIEDKYGSQINVVFHDVWTDSGREYADIYRIKLIPTQVFLDANGKEFFRHEGFFPETEIHKLLQKRGLKIRIPQG